MAKRMLSSSSKLKPNRYVFFRTYFFHLVFLFFLVNFVVTKALQLTFYAQSCMTSNQVSSDARCLYIYAGNVYEKGTRDNPHRGNSCGTDISSVLPGSHLGNAARYLDPNFVGGVCTVQPTPTPTSVPQPTNTPQPTAVPPTNTPQPTAVTQQPTATPQPTSNSQQPTASPTVKPTIKPTTIQQTTPTPTSKPSATPTKKSEVSNQQLAVSPQPSITQPINESGFGRYLAQNESSTSEKNGDLGTPEILPMAAKTQTIVNSWVSWSGLMVFASFVVLVSTILWGITRKIFGFGKSKR